MGVQVPNELKIDDMGHDSQIIDYDSQSLSRDSHTVNTLDSNQTDSAYIQVEIGDSLAKIFVKCSALIDTGADFNVMDLRLFNRLRQNGIQCELLKPSRKPPLAANNIPMKQFGDVELDLTISNQNRSKITTLRKVRFTVLRGLTCPLIVGIKEIRNVGLYVKGSTMRLGGLKICSISDGNKSIKLVDTYDDNKGDK